MIWNVVYSNLYTSSCILIFCRTMVFLFSSIMLRYSCATVQLINLEHSRAGYRVLELAVKRHRTHTLPRAFVNPLPPLSVRMRRYLWEDRAERERERERRAKGPIRRVRSPFNACARMHSNSHLLPVEKSTRYLNYNRLDIADN